MLVTSSNIREVIDSLPQDQAEELKPGCETWPIRMDGQISGQITVWPGEGVAAVSWGRDSFWGRWHSGERVILLEHPIDSNDLVVDQYGRLFVALTPERFLEVMSERFLGSWDLEGIERAALGVDPAALSVKVGCSRLPIFQGEILAASLLEQLRDPQGGLAHLRPPRH